MRLPSLILFVSLFSCLCMAPSSSHAEPDVIDAYYKQVEAMLMSERFDALDSVASKLRQTDERFPGGDQKLFHFYTGLALIKDQECMCGGYQSPTPFAPKEAILKKWLALKPQSIAAHIAMARMLINYAWVARGEGFASETSPAQFKLWEDRLAQAASYVHAVKGGKDPQIYGIYTTVARSLPSARKQLDSIYSDVTKAYPGWFFSYANRADILQEKWFGEPGELKAYLTSLLLSSDGDNGKIAYSYAVERLFQEYSSYALFRGTGMTWPSVKDAYAVREKHFGMSNYNWNVYLYLATAAADRAAALSALEHIGADGDERVWTRPGSFQQTVAWANAK